MRANDGDRLATARMKGIEDPILRSLIPGIMALSGFVTSWGACHSVTSAITIDQRYLIEQIAIIAPVVTIGEQAAPPSGRKLPAQYPPEDVTRCACGA
jgi:hypothetical protein